MKERQGPEIRTTLEGRARLLYEYHRYTMNILLIDNNDSFTRNLEHLLVSSIDEASVTVESYARLATLDLDQPDLIVISPGPGTPEEYPGYDVVFDAGKPVLGICLGMQILNEQFDGSTGRLAGCVHGKTDMVKWKEQQQVVARYHSLSVTQVGDQLDTLATNADGIPMCLGNAERQVFGYQFHPESFLTQNGGVFIHDALVFLGLA